MFYNCKGGVMEKKSGRIILAGFISILFFFLYFSYNVKLYLPELSNDSIKIPINFELT